MLKNVKFIMKWQLYMKRTAAIFVLKNVLKVEYTYDKNTTGNLTQVKDVNGKTTDYTYDTMDRLLTVKKKNTVGGTETDIIQSYGYEHTGHPDHHPGRQDMELQLL